ncbi:MAG: SUMF1/EgtB/PvdO family nonheme iron enzyme [Candidatus Cloacimonadota bacterium]|nr:SUMF1/EgtB/PvdO family nonheme iron enzyme [Candidatus Cloacimonadota bacterium]
MKDKKVYYIVLFVGIVFQLDLFALPKMLDVHIKYADSISISWKIDDPEENMQIELGCFETESKKIIEIEKKFMSGDIADIETKPGYQLQISNDAFLTELKEYTIFPKLIFDERIYYEMELIPAGSYHVLIGKNIIEAVSTRAFYVSKFEITNEQFYAFIDSDGYEIYEFWKIAKDIMSNMDVGWNYQGRLSMSKPHGWNFEDDPPWKEADSNFRYSPVTDIRWFEANAFSNWMKCRLPNMNQIKSAFSESQYESEQIYENFYMDSNGIFPLQNVKGGVSEWLAIGVPPVNVSCSAGCNEMFFIENNADNSNKPFGYMVKCPLYRNPALGFRIVIAVK